ncbi:unnamed protein product [Ophioblennius macclurei]
MEKPVRPVSEAYPSVRCSLNESVSYSSEAGLGSDEGDQTPIFSMSKSSMDVKGGGPPHKRDPAWTRLDLRRSSSTNTHCEQNVSAAAALKQLHTNPWLQQHAANNTPTDPRSPPALTDRWSGCSAQSRSSTPDTVVWRGASSRPSSLSQEPSFTPNSSMSKLTSSPTTPSPLISPLDAVSPLQDDPACPSPTPSTPAANQQEDEPEATPPNSPWRSPPPQTPNLQRSPAPQTPDLQRSPPPQTPDLQRSPAPQTPDLQRSPPPQTPDLHRSPLQTPEIRTDTSVPPPPLSCTEDEGFMESEALTFQFPSPLASPRRLLPQEEAPSDPKGIVDDLIQTLSGPPSAPLLDDETARTARSPATPSMCTMPDSPAEEQEVKGEPSPPPPPPQASRLELPEPSCPPGRGHRSLLVSSLSDSGLGRRCRCNLSAGEGVATTTTAMKTVTVDTAVQTASPLGSWWDLRRNMSNSNMDSHSILGSPPGSRLNLKSSVGSNSNLVSPSSSMFPVSSGEEGEGEEGKRGDDPAWDVTSASSHDLERRRSCLKMQAEEKDAMARRSSMKQVQWDEDGMTWDVHGAAAVDPHVLTSAIRKHLEMQNSPKPLRRSTKKKRAPKPPDASDAVTAAVATPPTVGDATEGDGGEKKEAEQEGEAKGEEAVAAAEAPRRRSRAEVDAVNDHDQEVYGGGGGGGGALVSKAQSHGGKRSVMRSLRRPGWCGGSKKEHD